METNTIFYFGDNIKVVITEKDQAFEKFSICKNSEIVVINSPAGLRFLQKSLSEAFKYLNDNYSFLQ